MTASGLQGYIEALQIKVLATGSVSDVTSGLKLAQFPRLKERGSIEAGCPSGRTGTGAAAFPRLKERGSIEAINARVNMGS